MPPSGEGWFVELLTVPESSSDREKRWMRLETSEGHFGLCSFGYLSLAEFEPNTTEFGIHVARPEMMALANLLEHPTIKPDLMKALIGGKQHKRSHKDLGRVLAIAYLTPDDELEGWAESWERALTSCFPDDWMHAAVRVGAGLRILLNDPDQVLEAHATCVAGLWADSPPTADQLRLVGLRLLQDAIDPLERRAALAGGTESPGA